MLENLNVLELISSSLISTLTALAVCFITLSFTNKKHKESKDLQQKNHKESLMLSEKKYQEQLLFSKENERLKYLPYLSLVPKHRTNKFEGDMIIENNKIVSIPFEISNVGAGIAFSIYVKLLDHTEKPEGMAHIVTSIKRRNYSDYDILGVREPIEIDVLRIEKQAEFCLYLSAVDKDFNEIPPTSDIRWEFEILFHDIQERKYSQFFTFYSSTRSTKIYRINSHRPKQIK